MEPIDEGKLNLKPAARPGRSSALIAGAAALVVIVAVSAFLAMRDSSGSGGRTGGGWLLSSSQRAEHSTLPNEKVPLAEPGVGEAQPSGGVAQGVGEGGSWKDRLAARMGGAPNEPPAPGKAPAAADPFAMPARPGAGGDKPIQRAAFKKEGLLGGGSSGGGAPLATGSPASPRGVSAKELMKGGAPRDPLTQDQRRALHAVLVDQQKRGGVMMGGARLPSAPRRLVSGNPSINVGGSGSTGNSPNTMTAGPGGRADFNTRPGGVIAAPAGTADGTTTGTENQGGTPTGQPTNQPDPTSVTAPPGTVDTRPPTTSGDAASTPGRYESQARALMLQIASEYVGAFRDSYVEAGRIAVAAAARSDFDKLKAASEKVKEVVLKISSSSPNGAELRRIARDGDRRYGTSFTAMFDYIILGTGDIDPADPSRSRPDPNELAIWPYLEADARALDPARFPTQATVLGAGSDQRLAGVKAAFEHRALLTSTLGSLALNARNGVGGASPLVGLTANLQRLYDACGAFSLVREANNAEQAAADAADPPRAANLQTLPYEGHDPCPIHATVEAQDWTRTLEEARDHIGGSTYADLTAAQQAALEAIARSHLLNISAFSRWLRLFSAGQVGSGGWDRELNPETDAWIALRNSCWGGLFLAACSDHELQIRTADGVAGYGCFLGNTGPPALYNFVAGDQATCERSIRARLGVSAQCSQGGGCGVSCGRPGAGCASANPGVFGACLPNDSGKMGCFVGGLIADIHGYRDVYEAELWMRFDTSGSGACPNARAAGQYTPGQDW